eukprot:CAMPEP_0114680370 /NCGR_PEP_ID=MMETSP0191-20121206/54055_1 /TAXON_ID=126664 /ORGANISM="Sorites sp." /LENGTH=77 /DNA_ID=CAMNT_0001957075 /DNA_START=62 /DNA_END=291 /DNA_ORIENTATION=+
MPSPNEAKLPMARSRRAVEPRRFEDHPPAMVSSLGPLPQRRCLRTSVSVFPGDSSLRLPLPLEPLEKLERIGPGSLV